MYILDALTLSDCTPAFNGEFLRGTWTFPCGLMVASELAHKKTEFEWGCVLQDTHRKHHVDDHTKNPWSLVVTRETQEGGWVRVTAHCDCQLAT